MNTNQTPEEISENNVQSIKNRILAEYEKHKDLDWAEIAARKINWQKEYDIEHQQRLISNYEMAIREFDKLKINHEKLSSKTFSCPVCDSMAIETKLQQSEIAMCHKEIKSLIKECDSMAERNRELENFNQKLKSDIESFYDEEFRLAKRVDELEKFLQDLYRHYELGNTIDCKIEQLLSNQNNKK